MGRGLTLTFSESSSSSRRISRWLYANALSGDWRDFRDCHVHPDLVLIYQKPDDGTLRLVRLGSHSALEL